ncbi:adenosylmethionine--8-amino-7-oxononanoate transaminase [Gottfriedia solisilvae]|uniref:Adenosylmethionine-8-amino-7-oxononanoate aminotransferase n=1 Tax=Gottfriedia solisilvae TaxID=1516104 RepID=A0A8J3ASE0_9BACI|nr:adenosylmethionine--8-amino-7-oxononanoate transaminase [Gottfriedia solisilvae]GGI15761.1 adenosylmethionine-8-amino-7-oxononanoate aminotransferase [Gottfriedia solisilvae]
MENELYQELSLKNKQYVWHPFTQMQDYINEEPLIISHGKDRKLFDVLGNEYYDGVSSIWLNVHGHNIKELNEAINEQLNKVAHSTLLGMANIPAILLAERLVNIAPDGLEKVFYSDSGATAVEIAIKMAYQYWRNIGKNEKNTFVTMKEAYHGDTIGAVSVGAIDLFHQAYSDLLFPSIKLSYPHLYRSKYEGTRKDVTKAYLNEVENLFIEKADSIAALIIEPIVQGASGIIVMPPGYLKGLDALCKKYEVLLIADEVATGFGRTGKMFACEQEGITPDILTCGKGLTGGYLPVSATLTTNTIYEAFLGTYEEQKTFFHGHSYTGNPLGCAVALANLDLFEKKQLINHVEEISSFIEESLRTFYDLQHVGDIRQSGVMIGIELVLCKETKEPFHWNDRVGVRVTKRAKELGLLTRPLGNVIVFMPPLASTKSELEEMLNILYKAISDCTEKQ